MTDTKQKTMITDLTEGSVAGNLLRFAFPLFASNLLQAIYNVVDMIVVGQVIGGAGMSAVSIGGELLHLLTFLAMGFSSAGQVIISQHVGAGRKDAVKKTIGTMFTFLFVTSILLSVICFVLREQILFWLNTPQESFSLTYDYAVTCICGLVFIYGYNTVSAILRGMGDSRRPFVFVAVAAILNIILDIWFVAGLGMKAFGAALATVIGQGVSFVASLIYLYRHREAFGFDFKPASFRISKRALKALLALGIPMAIQSAAVNISKIVLTAWINAFGVAMSAVGGLYSKLNTMFGVVSNSFTTAGSSMVGQCIGAEKYDRVPKIMKTNFAVMLGITLVTGAVLVFRQDTVFGLFTGDPEVLSRASVIVIPAIVNFLGATTRAAAFALINGSGNYRLNLCVAVIDGMIARVGIAWLLGNVFAMGCVGYWYGDAFAGFVPILIALCFYFSGKWKKAAAADGMGTALPKTTLYAASVRPLADPEVYRRAYESVSRERQQKADGYRFETDRCLCVGAELLLRHGLREAGIPAGPLCFRTNDCGKPSLCGTGPCFNYSHSGDMAVCAVSDVEVGCDIEKIRPVELKIAGRFFCPEEYAHIAGQTEEEERLLLFYRYWTLKESFLKATGLGFRLPLDAFCIEIGEEIRVRQSVDERTYFFREFDEIPGYRCAVCLAGERRDTELKTVDLSAGSTYGAAANDHRT